jgi:hypothetical protein
MALLFAFGMTIAIGALAQKWKGRTGAVWGFLTLILELLLYWLSLVSVTMHVPHLLNTPSGDFAMLSFSIGGAGLVMALIVATLPARTAAPPSA